MARFVIEKHSKRKPLWLLSVLACFPFDRSKSYPDIERYAIMEAVLRYLVDFTYKTQECNGVSRHYPPFRRKREQHNDQDA